MFWAVDGEVFEYRRLFQTDRGVSLVGHKPSIGALELFIARAKRGDQIIIESGEPLDTLDEKFGAIPGVILVGQGRTCLSRVVTEVAGRDGADRRQYRWERVQIDLEYTLLSRIFEFCGIVPIPKNLVRALADWLFEGGSWLPVDESLSDRLRRKCHSGWAEDNDDGEDRCYFSGDEQNEMRR